MSRTLLLTPLLFCLLCTTASAAPSQCSYDTYQWSTLEKRALNQQHVSHPYHELSQEERDRFTGCSVCREDQVKVSLPGIEPFLVCRVVAPAIEAALRELLEAGEPIQRVVGYRVGRTRGEADANGLRTRFSNHAYGVAIDINPEYNGLYDRCIDFGPHCRLIRGGEWQPQLQSASLRPNGAVVTRLRQEGFKWGGEIRGRQKDFMHFSPSGY